MLDFNTKENNKGIKVLSLFDGVSCGRIALERAGIPVEVYYASEIKEDAIKVLDVAELIANAADL